MDTEQRNELAALERAVAFLGAAAPRIPRMVNSRVCADFVGRVADIRHGASEQMDRRFGGRGATALKRELRQSIVRDHIAPLVAVGAAYRLTYFTVITMPGTRSRDHEFIEECLWVLTAAEHHGDELERLGLGASSREALRAALSELEGAVDLTHSARMSGVRTGIGIRIMLRQAWVLLRAVSRMVDAEPNLSAAELHEWRAAILHAPRPAHRLAAAKRLPPQLALPAGPEAQAVRTSPPSVPAEPTPSPAGSSLVVRARTDIAPAVGRSAPRPFARIIARVRLLLPLGDHAA